ncbi:Gar1-domain-containing protein [Pseudovirgaria hyperparasitica]|uniref:H/ACA ribonucleoprotein complex subunit n=1 Tax=Pseudovirgaria hyperparasitica TaxID=470096 RepID=A0A6A6W5A9_9PEZI|nr:Gar1-domain-containing protein [Pseudovirgaria hyperparasitica]KAF2758118.1 Gar1-domain-containing protein [Pseudovirgaria hyperparasitica]
MSFRGAPRGRGGGGGSFGGRGGSRGGSRGGFQSFGPPDSVFEMGSFMHACEGEIVCESINEKIPYFNAPIYLENKTPIGKVDEVLGPINSVYFTIKPQEGIVATSFKAGDKFYIGGDKLLPLVNLPQAPQSQNEQEAQAEAVEASEIGVDEADLADVVEAEELHEDVVDLVDHHGALLVEDLVEAVLEVAEPREEVAVVLDGVAGEKEAL